MVCEFRLSGTPILAFEAGFKGEEARQTKARRSDVERPR
jgi:hypothetical protein